MKIYISNFSSYKGNNGCSISNSTPKWAYARTKNSYLVPKWELVEKWNRVKNSKNSKEKQKVKEEYTKLYRKQLDELGIERILMTLEDGDVLLCWCGKDQFCHRYILADYLREHGVEVEEL